MAQSLESFASEITFTYSEPFAIKGGKHWTFSVVGTLSNLSGSTGHQQFNYHTNHALSFSLHL